MRWKLLLLGATAFWAVMAVELYRREIAPYFEYQKAPRYETVLGRVEEPIYRRFDVFLGASPIGMAEERISVEPGPVYQMEHRLRVDLSQVLSLLKGVHLTASSETDVNLDYELIGFRSILGVGGQKLMVNASRKGETLEINYSGMKLRGTVPLHFPRGTMLAQNFFPVQGNRALTVGQKWTMPMIDFDGCLLGRDPTFNPVYVSVEERAVRPVNGRDEVVHRVEVRDKATDEMADYSAWVMQNGTVIESTTKIGSLEVFVRLVESKRLSEAEYLAFQWQIPLD